MLAIGRIERQLPLPGRDWLARVGMTVALAASLGTVQVAVFWLEGVFQGASEAIADLRPAASPVEIADGGRGKTDAFGWNTEINAEYLSRSHSFPLSKRFVIPPNPPRI